MDFTLKKNNNNNQEMVNLSTFPIKILEEILHHLHIYVIVCHLKGKIKNNFQEINLESKHTNED